MAADSAYEMADHARIPFFKKRQLHISFNDRLSNMFSHRTDIIAHAAADTVIRIDMRPNTSSCSRFKARRSAEQGLVFQGAIIIAFAA